MKRFFIIAGCLFWSMCLFAQYDKADTLKEGLIKVIKNNKVGFTDAQHKLVIPLEYDEANAFSDGLAMVKRDGKVGYINAINKIVLPLIYNSGGDFYEGFALVGADKKYWIIDKKGKQTTVRKYDMILRDGDYSLISLDKKWGSINYEGQEVIAPEYDNLLYKREGLIAAKKGSRWGFIDSLDQVVLPFIYNDVKNFKGGIAIASKDYSYGTIDKTGKSKIAFQYDDLYVDTEVNGLWAKKKDKWGMVNWKDKELVPFKFDRIYDFNEYDNVVYAVVEIKEKRGLIDRTGNMLIPALYDEIYNWKDGYCGVGLNGKVGMVEIKTGKEVVQIKYNNLGFFESGLAMVMKWGSVSNPNDKTYERYGFVNKDGTEIVPLKYYEVRNFIEGMAAVRVSTQWGFVDSTGKEVIFPRYKQVGDFLNGKATVIQDDGEFFIDKKGRLSAKPAEMKIKEDETKSKAASIGDDAFSFEDLFDFSSSGANFQTYGKSSTSTPQIVLRESDFPTAAIVEKGKLGYRVIDVSQESYGTGNWIITLNKNNLGEQSVYLLDKLSQVPQAVKQMADKYSGYEITHISYTHKKWVLVFSGHPPVAEHKLFYSTAESGTAFPRAEIKEKFNSDFLIKRMAYGEGGWAILYTKDTAAHGQSVRGWGVVNTAEIDSMKNEGFFISNLIKAENIYYASFVKLKGKPTWYYQHYRTKPKQTPEALLEEGYILYRNFCLPD